MAQRRRWVLCAVVIVLLASPAAATDTRVADRIHDAALKLRQQARFAVDGESLSSTILLPAFYERRQFQSAWTRDALESLLGAIRDSALEGLEPRDYHLAALLRHEEGFAADESTAERRATVDLIATDALIRLGYHARFGKVDQHDVFANWNFTGPLTDTDPIAFLDDAISTGEIAEAVQGLLPQHPFYRAMRSGLAHYRAIGVAGGWEALPSGPTIKPGASDTRIPGVRRRLAIEGDLADATDEFSTMLDETLATAVTRFQTRHGLDADGAIGAGTIRAMNVPVSARIDQFRIGLDRARSVMHDLPRRFVLVNVAGFTVYVVDGDWPIWTAPVVVGKTATETPIFRADMRNIVLNPTWTVPPGIARNEIMPALRRDPNYLAKKGLTRQNGQFVQPAGPNNALGRIKLMFPNEHHVYLHDTPARALFEKTTRTFSHGCIRVQNPVELATLALDDPAWSRERLDDAIAIGETRTLNLASPLPVLVLYWTATVGPSGTIYLYDDVYQRDPAAIAALDAPFSIRNPRALVPRLTAADDRPVPSE